MTDLWLLDKNMDKACKGKAANDLPCLEKQVEYYCADIPEGRTEFSKQKCRELKRRVITKRFEEGSTTEQEYNQSISAFIKETENYLDVARSAVGAYSSAQVLWNQKLDTWNSLVAASNKSFQCRQLTPDQIMAALQDEEDGWWTRIIHDWWLPIPTHLSLGLVEPGAKVDDLVYDRCSSEIFEAIGTIANDGPSPTAIYELWEQLTKTRRIMDCINPYFTKFFNFVPYTFYISQLLTKLAGDTLLAMASLPEAEREQIEIETPCGMEQIESLLQKGVDGYRLPQIPDFPHIPPIPYIKIPGIMEILGNLIIDLLCYAICSLMEPMMAMVAATMEELFQEAMQLTTPSNADFSLGKLQETKMPELNKVDLSTAFSSEVLSTAIEQGLVSEAATISEIREYISYVTRAKAEPDQPPLSSLTSITMRNVVYLLMGRGDCRVFNILMLVGMDEESTTAYIKKYNDALEDIKSKVSDEATDESDDEYTKMIMNDVETFETLGLIESDKILKFWKYLGDNLNIFEVIEESKKDICIPDFCIEKDRRTVEDFIEFNKNLCNLLNPEVLMPDINLSTLFEAIRVDKPLVDSIKQQTATLFQLSSGVMEVGAADPIVYSTKELGTGKIVGCQEGDLKLGADKCESRPVESGIKEKIQKISAAKFEEELSDKYLQNISLAVDLTKLNTADYTRYTNDSIKTMYDEKMAGLSLRDVGKELERFSSALSLLGMDKNYRENMRVIMGASKDEAIKAVRNKAEASRKAATAAAEG